MKKLFFIILVLLLQGCADMTSSGLQLIYHQHSLKKSLTDQYINFKIFQAFEACQCLQHTHISFSTYQGVVVLAGEVPFAWQKMKASALVKQIPEVKKVYNNISLCHTSSLLTRVSDTWITAKIKAQLIISDDLDATQIKVLTENGTVYLIGTLPPEEARAAVDLASHTDGVGKVVRVFSYIHITSKA
ncbi:MAG TPA: BON domain-containing protein [Gammaproteobacteria bacterium]|jgi:osmotically-inducible protein OsmY|nr:BON domain-containing protein [Gammaproteobacteria bacterium]